MKNLLKIVILSAIFLILHVFSVKAQMKVGWKGGLNMSTLSGYKEAVAGYSSYDYSVEYTPAFHFGITTHYAFRQVFFLQPELLFSMQGIKEKTRNLTESSYLNFLQLPVYIGYKSNTDTDTNGIIGIGPYIGYGVIGSSGAYGSGGQFQRFDAGFTALVGIQIKKVQFTLGYDLGLVDQIGVKGWGEYKKEYGLPSVCNRNFKISLVYFHSSIYSR